MPVLFLSMVVLALAETAGAFMGRYRKELNDWLSEAVNRRPAVHGLTGNRDYDAELIPQIVFQSEAGLSFFHTHGEGMGVVVVAGGTIVSSLIGSRAWRGALHVLLGAAAAFPLGFLASAGLTITLGKDLAAEWAERWLLIPLGSAAIAAFVLMVALLVAQEVQARRGRGRAQAPPPGMAG